MFPPTQLPQRSLGVLMPHAAAPADVPAIAARAEALGFDSVWVPENCFLNGGVAAAGLALGATQATVVGIGVLASPLRHPAVAAMEVATLAQAYPGRLVASFGLGVPAWLDQMGLRPASALTAVREYVGAVRELLAGTSVSRNADTSGFAADEITLAHPAEDVPIAIGAVGPKMLELAGEVADVVILSTLAGPRYVRWAGAIVAAAAARAGRQAPRVVCFAAFHLAADDRAGRDAIRHDLAFSLRASGPGPLLDAIDASDALAELLADHPGATLAEAIPDSWLQEMAIAGDARRCASHITNLWEAGAHDVVLSPKPVGRAAELLAAAATELRTSLVPSSLDAPAPKGSSR